MSNQKQRYRDCANRAAVVYPHFLEARKRYQRLDRLWTYWMNEAYKAEKQTVEVTIIDSKLTRKKVDEFKKKGAKRILQALSPEEKKNLLKELQREM